MAKQQKKKSTSVPEPKKAKGPRPTTTKELLKKPAGMCKVLFPSLAPYMALELKRKNAEDTPKRRKR